MSRLISGYLRLLQIHPWKTTLIGTGCLVGTGDVIAQQVVERRGWKNHDIKRNIKMTCLGLFIIGPSLRSWYLILERLVVGTTPIAALKKMVLDQTLFAPSIIAAVFIFSDKFDGKTNEELKAKLSQSYLTSLKSNYVLWPAVQLTNFYFIPFQHRVMFVNFVALFWNTYLTWIVNKEPVSTAEQKS